MFEMRIDTSEFERKVRELGGRFDQMPYAMSRALNSSLRNTRTVLVQSTWPKSVKVKNRGFIGAALHMEFSTKNNLTVAITDAKLPGRAHLALHADGGVKQAKGNFAVPSSNVRVGSSGVVASQRARVLVNSFRKGDTIYQRITKGKKAGGLKLMFTLRPTIFQRPDVPFRQDFADAMLNGIRTSFLDAFRRAMGSAR
jgi:hypothetical protein